MSCVLRIGGPEVDAAALLVGQPLKGASQSRSRADNRLLMIQISNSGAEDLAGQVTDAQRFLQVNQSSLATLLGRNDLETTLLEFAVQGAEGRIESKVLPPELLQLAGSLGLSIELTVYPASANACSG